MTNGLLSKAEREFLKGERDVKDPNSYRGNVRYRARQRIDQIQEDLELLVETGNEDIAKEFHDTITDTDDLQAEVNELWSELEDLKESQASGDQ